MSETVATPDTAISGSSTPARRRGWRAMWMDLTKLRLNILVLLTTAVGYVLGRHGLPAFDWAAFGVTLLGTGLAAEIGRAHG